ncbi:MAG TPA: mechanosensitive ion channel domain-containing protein [Vicinamibacterales bacterium]|jgi:small-conductance mechanosensitive channel|nr:mechanosensitive ion channel domain-containing protein [Vicinamibacterales bacterium]
MSRRIQVLLLALIAALTAIERLQAQGSGRGAAADEVATAPVEIDGAVLFRLRGVSSLPAEERARAASDRIVAAAADPTVSIDSLRVIESESVADVAAGDKPLVRVVDADAALEQVGRRELAYAHLSRVRQAIVDYREARTPAAVRRAANRTAIATALLLLGIGLVLWFWRRLDAFLTRRLEARIHTVGIQSFEVMRAERIRSALKSGMVAIRNVVLLAGLLIYLGSVLATWPRTRGLSRDMFGLALAPLRVIGDGVVANIPSVVFLAVLFFVTRLVLRVVRLFFEAIARGTVKLSNFDADWAAPTYKIVRVVIVAFALIVAYPYIPGSESDAFKGVSLFIGIVFSLGSSSAISNIIAGYMMTYRRAFKVGDRVKIGEAMGDVMEMRLQVTHLKSFKNEEIVIPNSQILGGDVVNYSSLAKAQGLILHTDIGIGYETPWRQVEAMLLTAAARCASPSDDSPRAFVRLKKLGDFAVTYELNVYCTNIPAMLPMYTAMHSNILDVFNEYGVQIMTPAYEGDPPEPKVVPPKDWFTAPAAAPSSGAFAPTPADGPPAKGLTVP